MKTKYNNPTIFKFRFLKESAAFRVGASDGSGKLYGNFFPQAGVINKPIPGIHGNNFVLGADLNHVFEIELEPETVRGLPSHIAQHSDESVKNAYRVEQAKEASEAHRRNNAFRDEFQHYADMGMIEIISDSFMDEQKVLEEDEPVLSEVRKAGRPKKDDTNG